MESRVLSQLSAEEYTSGASISRELGITRSAVWKHIGKLRQRGYAIEAAPRHGYRLAGRPDKLLPDELRRFLRAGVIGSRIIHFEETGSTADAARRLIDEGAPEGTVVVAESQTAGRGRMGRSWITPPGTAIAISVILYPRLNPTRVPLLSLGTALAVKRAVDQVVRKETGAAAATDLKWPNDVYLNGKKLGGVLVETAAELDRVRWAIASAGLNVNNEFSGTELAGRATSLAQEFDRSFSRRALAAAILNELDRVYSESRNEAGLQAIRSSFEQHDLLEGRRVDVTTPEGLISGTAAGIDAEGRLLVREAEGKMQALFSGEATLSP